MNCYTFINYCGEQDNQAKTDVRELKGSTLSDPLKSRFSEKGSQLKPGVVTIVTFLFSPI